MKTIKQSELGKIIKECDEAFFDIPFGNSEFQTVNFIINAAHTPERAYRAVGLAARAKIQALKEAYYNLKKDDVDIAELKHKAGLVGTSEWDKARHTIEIERKQDLRSDAMKLINDALAELAVLYAAMQKFPRYTREQFEAGERKHFHIRLIKQALGLNGPLESLDNMGEKCDPASIDRSVVEIKKLTDQLKLLE